MKLHAGIALLVCLGFGVSTAHAQTATAPTATAAEPSRNALAIDLTFPWDATALKGANAWGLGGVGFAVGARAGRRWYLGGVAEIEAVMYTGAATADNPAGINTVGRERLGGEVRYYLDDRTTSPSFFSHERWIGLRYGAETVDSRATVGRFADVTLGHDSVLGAMRMGLYVSAGLSFETATAYDGTPDPTPTARVDLAVTAAGPVQASPYLALGMRLGF